MINSIIPKGNKLREFLKKFLFDPKVPAHISRNFIRLKDSDLNLIEASLKQNYFSKEPDGYLSTDIGKNDLMDHLILRLEENRKYRIPWLYNVKPLRNAKILEIGCGTGCSTVALAEQGAKITAVDIDDKALIDNKNRCAIYGLDVTFLKANATEIARILSKEKFDIIIFWACLEHMTHDERMTAMKDTWDMLPSGSFWCVTETPNRLWFFDSHTSHLHFFLWLPDDLAIKYSRFSPWQKYRESFVECDRGTQRMLEFFRWGRGLSFHEFELTIKSATQLNVISAMMIYHRNKRVFPFLRWKYSLNYRYESLLRSIYPNIHRGFYQPYLDLIIKKD